MRSQFNSLASNFQDNVNSLAKFTDKKLNEFRIQTEDRFTKFEQAIANVDVLKEEIEKLLFYSFLGYALRHDPVVL